MGSGPWPWASHPDWGREEEEMDIYTDDGGNVAELLAYYEQHQRPPGELSLIVAEECLAYAVDSIATALNLALTGSAHGFRRSIDASDVLAAESSTVSLRT